VARASANGRGVEGWAAISRSAVLAVSAANPAHGRDLGSPIAGTLRRSIAHRPLFWATASPESRDQLVEITVLGVEGARDQGLLLRRARASSSRTSSSLLPKGTSNTGAGSRGCASGEAKPVEPRSTTYA